MWSMPVSFLRKRAGRRRVENGSGGENEDMIKIYHVRKRRGKMKAMKKYWKQKKIHNEVMIQM